MWYSVQGVHRKPLIMKRPKAELTDAKSSKKTLFLWDPKAATQEALFTGSTNMAAPVRDFQIWKSKQGRVWKPHYY